MIQFIGDCNICSEKAMSKSDIVSELGSVVYWKTSAGQHRRILLSYFASICIKYRAKIIPKR